MSRVRLLAVLSAGVVLSAVVPAQAAGAPFGTRSLGPGATGHDVRVLQDLLSRVGIGTPVDGRFGASTRAQVRAWEARRAAPVVNGGVPSDRTPGPVRFDGRLSRREARLLQGDVDRAEAGRALKGTPPVAVAPDAAPAGEKAVIGAQGRVVAPASAPAAVKRMIAAANEIHDLPYRYGGGHAASPNRDSAYDCSGSMSYALQGAGLLDGALDSSGFARYGASGPGEWVTIHANAGHSYMVIAGLRFDTSGRKDAGSRWQVSQRSGSGYVVRHPPGL